MNRVARIFTTAALLMLGATSSLLACPQCFGAEETSLVDATKLGILVLLGIVLAVQGLFAAFFIRLRNRAKRAADVELANEWSALQRAPKTS